MFIVVCFCFYFVFGGRGCGGGEVMGEIGAGK